MATEVRVSQILTEAEVEAEAALLISQLGVYAEVSQDELRVSQMGVYVELEFIEPEPTPEVAAVATYHPLAHGSRAMHQIIPDEITGYPFDPVRSWWTVVVPEESENFVQDPSFESGTLDTYFDSDWESVEVIENAAVGATGGRRVLRLEVDPVGANGSFEWASGTPVTPGPYTFSVDVYCTRPGWTFQLRMRLDTQAFRIKTFTVQSSGWQRVEVTGVVIASGTGDIQFLSPATNTGQGFFYLDRLQYEAKKYATTPFDGDSIGWYDSTPIESYFWRGAAYQSASVRRANTGTGGRLVHLSEMEFATTTILGLGMGPVEQRLQAIGRGKERFLGAHEVPRDFTITGVLSGENWTDLSRKRQALIDLFRIDNTRGREPILLRYQPTFQTGEPYGLPLEIMCAYREGLGGNTTNLYQETIPLQFHSSNPFPQETIESSYNLTLRQTLVSNYLFMRQSDGDYVNLGTGATTFAVIFDIDWDVLGNPIVIGDFTALGGDSVVNIAGWNGSDWGQYGEGPLNDNVRTVHAGREFGGEILIGGDFTEYLSDLTGLPVALNHAARLLGGGGWQILANGFNDSVFAIARDENGNAYIGGQFTSDSDDLDADLHNIALWDAEDDSFAPLGQGVALDVGTSQVSSIVIPGDGYVYLAGDFNRAIQTGGGLVFGFNVIRWNIAAAQWELMGTGTQAGVNGEVTKMMMGKDGMLYIVGNFTESDGIVPGTDIDLRGFARFNGYAWEEVFPLSDICASMQTVHMTIDQDGVFWFSTWANDGFETPEFGRVWLFGWRNGVFYPPPYHVQGATADGMLRHGNGPDGSMLFFSEETGDNVWVPAMNSITYGGNADVTPTIVFGDCQPALIYHNYQKGGIYFRPTLDVGTNEQMRIPGDVFRQKVYSNFRLNMMRHISVGATDLEKVKLTSGVNRISVFVRDDGALGDNAAGFLLWRNRYWSIDPGAII